MDMTANDAIQELERYFQQTYVECVDRDVRPLSASVIQYAITTICNSKKQDILSIETSKEQDGEKHLTPLDMKPCPFCGGDFCLSYEGGRICGCCWDCGAKSSSVEYEGSEHISEAAEKAMEKWNMRVE